MKNSLIIIKKQLKDTLKNKAILIQFILYPAMALIMENAIHLEGMENLFFTKMFSVMYIGMAPLAAVAAIVSEEKEKNTLRVLMMANVKPWEYLLGVGTYAWLICMVGAGAMATGFSGEEAIRYLCVMGIGFIISIVAGACVGIYAKNQMSATSLVMPVMIILAFIPMIAIFNDKIAKISRYLYTQQLRNLMDDISMRGITSETWIVMAVNAAIFLALFGIIFKRKGLE